MKLYRSNDYGNKKNTTYNIVEEINNLEDFKRAAQYDHVMCRFKENKRSNANFLGCDVLFADVDNASDTGENRISIKEFRNQFSDYEYYLATSRNHNKEKDGNAARNRFHVYFPIKEVTSKRELSVLLKALTNKYAFFDKSVKDPSRFFFGHKETKVDYNQGKSILVRLSGKKKPSNTSKSILKTQTGERNSTLFRAACSFKNQGLSEDIVSKMVSQLNESFDDPLEAQEVDSIIESAFRYENQNPRMTYEETMKHYSDKHIIIKVGSKTVVLDKRTYEMQDYKNADLYYANEKMTTKSADKKGNIIEITQNAFPIWFETTDQRYERLVFKPDNILQSDEYNLWTGFGYEEKNTGSCALYLDHIKKNICSDDEILYGFVLDWMAQTIQEPEKRPGIALALRGEQGVGKGIFANTFGLLFGEHYLYVSDLYSLTNHFNGHLANKLLVFADEAIWGGDKKAESTLKSLISEPKEVIEYKGKDAVRMDNYKRIIFATNSDWVVPVDKDDRRYVVLDVAGNNKKDRDYFGRMIQQMENGGYEKFLYMLKSRDLSKRQWSKLPMTRAKVENILFGFNSVGKWINNCLENGSISKRMFNDWNVFAGQSTDKEFVLKTEDAFKMFDNYNSEYRMGGKYIDERSIGIWLSKMIGVEKIKKQVGGHRGYYYRIPPFGECRKNFNEYVRYDLYKEDN